MIISVTIVVCIANINYNKLDSFLTLIVDHCPQYVLLYLAGGCLGQLAEDNFLGSLPVRHFGARPGNQLCLGHRAVLGTGGGFARHEGTRHFAPFLVRHRHHGDFHYSRVGDEHSLHVNGRNVFTAGDNDV